MPAGVQTIGIGVLMAIAMAVGAWLLLPLIKGNPDKRERKRRLQVNRQGRVGDAMITEASESTIYYVYALRGVQYETSQDIAALRDYLPAEPERLIGQAHVKYLVNNPANSILVCEEWSGLRSFGRTPSKPPLSEPPPKAAAARHF